MDSRMIPTRFTQTNVGDMFIVRNAGNLVPHSTLCGHEEITTEPAALELGCVINGIKHVIVCGHSDCKAMNMLHLLKNSDHSSCKGYPLKLWLYLRHGHTSIAKFARWKQVIFNLLLSFQGDSQLRRFVAYIDPDNRDFCPRRQLSQDEHSSGSSRTRPATLHARRPHEAESLRSQRHCGSTYYTAIFIISVGQQKRLS
ncbi:UNVERIFIED_CONTAM: hypothetical protein GTU68_054186 [Idotea baltica]|nr:hypothetical protein [Idotea baltica]